MTSVAYIGREAAARPAPTAWLFAAAVFASAALVFLVEPLVGKLLLPTLGGSAAIWNTSLAFFQIALLGGYAYAHALQRIGSLRRQLVTHVLVLACAALFLPLRISGLFGPPWENQPALWLAAVLAVSLGAPFAALSATAPLLQAWWARLSGESADKANAYRLYAASNLGSVLALAAYPILVEPLLGLSVQTRLWSLAYAVFVLLLMGLAALVWRTHAAEISPRVAAMARAPATPAQWRERLTWMLLAAAPASLLNGVTAHLTADVASAPFLWVIPLELYLATFVIAFSGRASGPPSWLLAAQLGATPLALMMVFEPNSSLTAQMVVHLWGFFVTALVCHATLAARRPEPGRLTEFYLWMSLGGVLGGSFNAFLAPLLFPQVWEYPAVLVLACLARPASPKRMDDRQRAWLIAGLLWTTPLLIPGLQMADIVRQALMLAPVVIAIMLRDRRTAVVLLYAALALGGEVQGVGRYREHHRSFFGVAHITEIDSHGIGPVRVMVHGTTLHGVQALSPAMRCRATSYYVPATVIGQVFQVEQAAKPRMRMGIVGLGAGTVATFVRPGDSMRFFEIDPLMKRLALDTRLFTFINGCAKGPVDVVIGDARLSLAKEPAGSYDLLMLDAFSSDSVPTHLLTVEAMQEYLKLLKPGGVLLLHLSNRNLELTGPTAAAARAAGATVLKGEHWVDPSISHYVEASEIVLLASLDPHSLDPFRDNPEWTFKPRPARAWTDDYTNLWGAMIARFQGEP